MPGFSSATGTGRDPGWDRLVRQAGPLWTGEQKAPGTRNVQGLCLHGKEDGDSNKDQDPLSLIRPTQL